MNAPREDGPNSQTALCLRLTLSPSPGASRFLVPRRGKPWPPHMSATVPSHSNAFL